MKCVNVPLILSTHVYKFNLLSSGCEIAQFLLATRASCPRAHPRYFHSRDCPFYELDLNRLSIICGFHSHVFKIVSKNGLFDIATHLDGGVITTVKSSCEYRWLSV